MARFRIPGDFGRIRQQNNSDVYGELWETYSMDLTTSYGKLKTSDRAVKVLDEDDDLGSDVVQALVVYGSRYYTVTDGNVYYTSVNSDPSDPLEWNHETAIDDIAIDFESDAVVFDGLLLISESTDIGSYNGTTDSGNWWQGTVSGAALTNSYPHMMHVHRGGQETLFVTDQNHIRYYNSTAGHSTIDLQEDLVACCVDSGIDATWVGTYAEESDYAYMYEVYVGEQVDGSPVARNAYRIDGRAVLAVTVVENVPYIITEKGHIQMFNGVGFETVQRLPFDSTKDLLGGVRLGLIQDSGVSRPIHPKGIKSFNESLYFYINTDLYEARNYPGRATGGVWEYNTKTRQLTHRFGLSELSTGYGAKLLGRAGPIMIAGTNDTFMLIGGEVEGEGNGLFATDISSQYGYFVTRELNAEGIQDAFEEVVIKAKTLSSGESITLKYRTTEKDRIVCRGSFVDGTTFNTIEDISAVAVGDEMTITAGVAQKDGATAHVTSVTETAGTFSVELDTDIGTTGGTNSAEVEFQNWTKIDDTYTSADGEYKIIGVNQVAPWIQYKVVCDGDITIREFVADPNVKSST